MVFSLENFIVLVIILISIHALLKERHDERGCIGGYSFGENCNDQNSSFLKGTKYSTEDNCKDIKDKMKHLFRFGERGAVWRRSLLVSIFLVLMVFISSHECSREYIKQNKKHQYILLLFLFTGVLYFYHNYLDFHYFRNIKKNGVELVDNLENKCFTKLN